RLDCGSGVFGGGCLAECNFDCICSSEMQKISVFWLKRSDSWDWCGINKFIILLCVVNTVKQYKVKLTTLIFYALALSLILSLTFSAPTLNHFYPYSEEGGSAYHKI